MPPSRGPVTLVACVDKTSTETPVDINFFGKSSPSILLRNEKSTLQRIPLKQEIIIIPSKSREKPEPIMNEKIKQKREIRLVTLIITTCPDTIAPVAKKNKPDNPTNINLQVIKNAAILALLV